MLDTVPSFLFYISDMTVFLETISNAMIFPQVGEKSDNQQNRPQAVDNSDDTQNYPKLGQILIN